MKVNTVLGPVEADRLGLTLMHEHIINIEWNFARAFPGFYDREQVVELFCQEMETLKPYGVRTFVDATPITLGRDVELMRRCSERAGVHIIACTGIYWQEAPFFHQGVDPRVLADYLIREIEHGMEGTDSRPAFIKCASQLATAPSENNANMIRAAAIASRATGLPIYTHTQGGSRLGEYQKQILVEEGIAPEKIAFGHTFGQMDGAYVRGLMEGGGWASCDQLAFAKQIDVLADLLAELMKGKERGQLFLSCDAALRSDFGRSLCADLRDRDKNPLVLRDRRKTVLFERMLPALRERGVREEWIHQVLVDNPRRFLTGEGAV